MQGARVESGTMPLEQVMSSPGAPASWRPASSLEDTLLQAGCLQTPLQSRAAKTHGTLRRGLRRSTRLVPRDPGVTPRREISGFEVGARLRDEIEIEMHVVHREQRAAQNFTRDDEMPQIAGREVAARVIVEAFDK